MRNTPKNLKIGNKNLNLQNFTKEKTFRIIFENLILKIFYRQNTPFLQLNPPLPSRTCDDGTKYLYNRVCDGIMDCADGSDETEALCNELCHPPHIWVTQNNCINGGYFGMYNIVDLPPNGFTRSIMGITG